MSCSYKIGTRNWKQLLLEVKSEQGYFRWQKNEEFRGRKRSSLSLEVGLEVNLELLFFYLSNVPVYFSQECIENLGDKFYRTVKIYVKIVQKEKVKDKIVKKFSLKNGDQNVSVKTK